MNTSKKVPAGTPLEAASHFNNDFFKSNVYFKNISRAPYELGHLLRTLPVDFSADATVSNDVLPRARAALSHAQNASSTILNGLESIGELLFAVNSAESNEVATANLASLGCLIQHLAVEAQYLSQTEVELRFEIEEHAKRETTAIAQGGKYA